MVDWQITATTVYCDAVGDDVTLMVYGDWSVKCTGHKRYGEPAKDTMSAPKKKSKQLGCRLECIGPECERAVQYKDRLFAEEVAKGHLAGGKAD